MSSLFSQSMYCYRALVSGASFWGFVANNILRPVMFVLMCGIPLQYALGGRVDSLRLLSIVVFCAVPSMSFGIVECFGRERWAGTMSLVLISTGSKLENFLARALFHFPAAITSIAFGGMVFAATFDAGLEHADHLTVVVAVAVILLSVAGFMLFVGSLATLLRNWGILVIFVDVVLMLATDTLIPIHELPKAFQALGTVLPISHGIDGFRAGLTGASLRDVHGDLLLEAITGFVYLVAGYVIFRLLDRLARRGVLLNEV